MVRRGGVPLAVVCIWPYRRVRWASSAVNDLLPMHAQLQAAHDQALHGLTQNSVDRSALEAARVAHLQLADQASKRITQLIGDVGDVLTPTQRSALATHLKKLHGMQHS